MKSQIFLIITLLCLSKATLPDCTGCVYGSTGPCKSKDNVCYSSYGNDQCWPGTYPCDEPASMYACTSGSCSISQSGTYSTLSDCQSACTMPKSKYACNQGTCSESSTGSYDSLSSCQSVCSEPKTKYSCNSGSCIEDASGKYDSISDCQSVCVQPSSKRVVNLYQLINSIDSLNQFLEQLTAVNNKPNFNRISLSFVQPSIHSYTKNNLACTGIMGHYCDNRKEELAVTKSAQLESGSSDFTALKNAIKQMHTAGLEVFLSVGGWDYNCREDLYCETLKYYNKSSAIVCDASVNYSYVCEPKGANQDFDYFPDPSDESWADKAYANIISLAEDLGCDGVDLDYEEFWHADYYRRDWNQEDFIGAVRSQSWKNTSTDSTAQEHMQYYYDNLSFDDMVSQFASAQPNNDPNAIGPFILPDTVDKLYRIIQSLQKAGPNMKFAFAGPAVGAMPIMVPQYGDSNSLLHGGQWWGGNLKGMLYSLVMKYGESVLVNWDLGLMTYDLGSKSGMDCGSGLPFGCSLQEQVEFYAGSYIQYLKNDESIKSEQNIVVQADVKQVVPKYFNVPGLSTMFGFEIGRPAYPSYDDSWKKMVLLETDVDAMLKKMGSKHEGVIVWEMFKPTSNTYTNEASTKYCAQKSCQYYQLGSDYDCNANIPYVPKSDVVEIEKLFLQ